MIFCSTKYREWLMLVNIAWLCGGRGSGRGRREDRLSFFPCWGRFLKFVALTWINTKIRKERGNSYWKNEEISRRKAHTNTQKLNWTFWWSHMSFLIRREKDVCDRQYISIMLPCICCVFHLEISSFIW